MMTSVAETPELTADTVAQHLRADDTRGATLQALEAVQSPIPPELALAAAPALTEVAATTEDRKALERCGLMVARLLAEFMAEQSAMYSAACGGERLAGYFAPRLIMKATKQALLRSREGGQQLWAREDAYSFACLQAFFAPLLVRGLPEENRRTKQEFLHIYMSVHPLASKKQMLSPDVPKQLLIAQVELLRSCELPELAIGGAWWGVRQCLDGRPELAELGLELGLFDLAVEHVRAIGSPADVVSISRGKAGRGYSVLEAPNFVAQGYIGQKARPDLDACVSCGLFDFCVEIVVAFAAAGVDGLQDTDHAVLFKALSWLAKCSSLARCEVKIRRVAAAALAFCLEHSLTFIEFHGMTTGSYAARVCCSVFGRDEGGSDFTFTPLHIQLLTENWSQMFRATGWFANTKPGPDVVFAAQLCVSDQNKPLLIANGMFIPYLVDALLLKPEHPRAGLRKELKAWCQQHHCEALCQLAVHKDSRKALLRDASVVPALELVAQEGLNEEVRETAAAALAALEDKKLVMATDGQKHLMLSYQWSYQATMQRINKSLIARGYSTWFDLTNMKGSTMDAMSDAIEGADVMLYGVSLAYKESANCRLEANYGHQQELDMIPLILQENYKPQGWLGLIMGTRMWYAMWDAEKDDDTSFERRVDNVARELGERGKLMVAELVPPLREPNPAPTPPPGSVPSPSPVSTSPPASRAQAPTAAPSPSLSPTSRLTTPRTSQPDSAPIMPRVSPSMEQRPVAVHQSNSSSLVASTTSASLIEASAFIMEQLKTQLAEQRAHDKVQHLEVVRLLEGQLEAHRQELEKQRREVEAQRKELEAKLSPACVITQEQLAALQSRLQALHVAKLLTDDELFLAEDYCGDIIELESSISGQITSEMAQANPTISKVSKLVALSERVTNDAALARQIRRRLK